MTENGLPGLAQKLTRGEGKPDILARRSVLDHLVDGELSSWEIRYLRDRLNALPLDLDIFMNLPHELLLCIVRLLDLKDFLAALAVSRAWNQRFSSPDVCITIVKENFRSTWEKSYNGLARKDQELAKITLSKCLVPAAVKRLRREHYQFRTVKSFTYGQEETAYFPEYVNAQYNTGMVGFRGFHDAIVVQAVTGDDPPRFVRHPDRVPIEEWLLSDQFFIAQNSSNKLALDAWDRELNHSATVRVPNSIRHMSAYQERAGLITHGNEALVWHIGGPLKLLNTSDVLATVNAFDRWETSSVLFHPADKDTAFVIHQAWSIPMKNFITNTYRYTIRLIVQEFFQEQSKRIKYFDSIYSLKLDSEPDPFQQFSKFFFELKCSVNAEGLCGVWRKLLFSRGGDIHSAHHVKFVTFDMYHKKFDDWHDITIHPGPEYPVSAALTIHGHEFVMSSMQWRRGIPDSPYTGYGNSVVQADYNFVVVFGERDYAVLTL